MLTGIENEENFTKQSAEILAMSGNGIIEKINNLKVDVICKLEDAKKEGDWVAFIGILAAGLVLWGFGAAARLTRSIGVSTATLFNWKNGTHLPHKPNKVMKQTIDWLIENTEDE